jgi:hypothetical protein
MCQCSHIVAGYHYAQASQEFSFVIYSLAEEEGDASAGELLSMGALSLDSCSQQR